MTNRKISLSKGLLLLKEKQAPGGVCCGLIGISIGQIEVTIFTLRCCKASTGSHLEKTERSRMVLTGALTTKHTQGGSVAVLVIHG